MYRFRCSGRCAGSAGAGGAPPYHRLSERGARCFRSLVDVEGLQSFADKTTLDFRTRLPVVVVGPNGSGKSNIVLLRVAWARRAGARRCGGQDGRRLFAWTADRPALGRPECLADIATARGLLPIEFIHRVTITRICSARLVRYLINVAPCRLLASSTCSPTPASADSIT